MSNRRITYYPLLVYSFLLVAVWLLSWLLSVLQLLLGVKTDITSLVSSEGVRWALLSVNDSLNAAPWGSVLFMLLVAGLLSGSGFAQPLLKMVVFKAVSENEKRSLLFSSVALIIYIIIIAMFTVYPWHTLLGVTGELTDSPIAEGWLLMVFVGVLVVSLVYGFIYGNYRTMTDVGISAGKFVAGFLPALLAMIPATGLLPCLQFTSLAEYLGINEGNIDVVVAILYLLPFVFVVIADFKSRR